MMNVIIWGSFMKVRTTYHDYDYSEFLGKDYLETQKLPVKASTLVSNHQCWLDSLILITTPMMPGFAAKDDTRKVWLLNRMIENLQSIYISRGGNDEERTL